jgi:hypothetical protein
MHDAFDQEGAQSMHNTARDDLGGFRPLHDEIAFLGQRMERIELALNRILERMQLPGLDEELHPESEQDVEEENQDNSFSDVRLRLLPINTNFAEHVPGPYIYTPLDTSKSHIRLLAVLPAANFNDPIIAELKIQDLDDDHPPRYTALSYCWGAPVMDRTIVLAGQHFPVTTNLELALRHMRDAKQDPFRNFDVPTMRQWYWIDQICINQADLDERGSKYS